MNLLRPFYRILPLLAIASPAFAQTPAAPYKIVQTSQLMGTGGIDYVFADSVNRHLYVPRGNSVLTFDLDSLKPLTPIPGLMGGHGVAVDPVSNHAFSSSNPILMWDAKTLQPIKTIAPQGRPDGILFEPFTERIYVLSHSAPNVTVINGTDGSIAGTIDLGGAPEQAQSDGQGHVYIDLEDKDAIAVVDASAMKLTGTYSLQGKGGGPGGLGLDAKNGVLFAFCHEPAVAVILSATDGKILDTQPIGRGTDGGGFNPNTMEAFSSQGDGTLTIIKENTPTSFAVEQTVQTMPRAKTCTLDTQTNHIIVIATERPAPSPGASPGASPATASTSPVAAPSVSGTTPQIPPGGPAQYAAGDRPGGPGGPGGRRGGNFYRGPAMLHILVIGS
jgi:DNA-binding beta-propeller fold protein YncE